MKAQLHVGLYPTPDYEFSVLDTGPGNKPYGKVLWTSTFDPKIWSDWVQWLKSNWDDGGDSHNWPGYLLTPSKDARIYTIDGVDDLLSLWKKYPAEREGYSRYEMDSLDFVAISRDWDAVHLSKGGLWSTRNGYYTDDLHMLSLYGWDCESTVWFRWKFVSVHDLGVVKCREGGRKES